MRTSSNKIGLFLLPLLFVSACSSPTVRDSAPRRTPAHLDRLPDPVVRALPRSKSGNKSPYSVLGKSYTLLPRAEGYRARGNASWYGAKFHGRLTSSGERYNMYTLTAAHKSLPIPCFARVTNQDNGKSTIVRVNDRGPFHSDRIIDLSYAAAIKLGFANKGTARVLVEVVTPASQNRAVRVLPQDPTPLANSVAKSGAKSTRIFLQAGAFRDWGAASRVRRELQNLLGQIVQVVGNPDGLYRVNIGPLSHLTEANRIQALMLSAEFAKPLILRR